MEQQLSPTSTREIQYFTEMDTLVIPEYGRNIQNLIKYAITIEDKEKRQRVAETIIKLMTQVSDLKHKPKELQQKLWNHLMKISDYKLDVDIPEDVIIVDTDLHSAVEPLEYPPRKMQFKHYGRIIQKLIAKAKKMPEGELRDQFNTILGAYMKLAFQNWHRDRNIPDETIIKDFARISDGKLSIPEGANIDYLAAAPLKRQTKILKATSSGSKSHSKKKRKRKSSNGHRRNKVRY